MDKPGENPTRPAASPSSRTLHYRFFPENKKSWKDGCPLVDWHTKRAGVPY